MGWDSLSLVVSLAISVVLALPNGPQLQQKFKHTVPNVLNLPKYIDDLADASENMFNRAFGHDISKRSLVIRSGKNTNYRYPS